MKARLLLGCLLTALACPTASCGGDSAADSSPATGGSAGAGGSTADAAAGGAGGSVGPDADGVDQHAHDAPDADGAGGSPTVWQAPACSAVKGTWAVTFTTDDGVTVAPGEGTLSGVAYTYGLAASDTPNVLVAEHAGRLLRSEDAGCTWTDIGAAPATTVTLTAARAGRVYGYQMNSNTLFRLDGTTVTSLKFSAPIHGLGVDPADGDHLMIGSEDGQIWESTDAGASFDPVGNPAPHGCFYVVAFDPTNLKHIVCGTMTEGTFVTMDGAQSWVASEGDATYANINSVAISPADPHVVWIEGFQLGWHNGQQIGPEGRRIWRSTDGGLNFMPLIVEEDTPAHLFNGNLLAAHPLDPNVLYFTFGTPPIAGMPSESWLYRFDASTSELVAHKQDDIDGYDALVFSPADPNVIYLGKTSERPDGL